MFQEDSGKDVDGLDGKTVCMVVKNRLSTDARVKKEISALAEDGWKVTVIAEPEKGREPREESGGITVIRPPVRSSGAESLRRTVHNASKREDTSFRAILIKALRRNRARRFFADLARDIPWEMSLRREAFAADADVYHANDLDTLEICGLAAARNGARLVYDSHELWLESSRFHIATGPIRRQRLRRIEARYAPRADAVISVTPMRGRRMMEMYPSIKRMEIIENAPEKLEVLPPRGTLRNMIGAGEDTIIALYQGVICPERGLEELVEAARMSAGIPGLKFVVIGMDAWNGTLHDMVRSRGLDDLMAVLPPVTSEELPGITVDADMGFILFRNTCLNHYYSLPNKLYEYMMAGVPVISSGFPELARVIGETSCGITVNPEDPKEIAEAVRTLAERPAERRSMSLAGRAAALAEHNWSPERKRLVDLYREIMTV